MAPLNHFKEGRMAYRSLVKPNMGFQVLAGNCLAMAQGIVGAPIMYESATDAANATKIRHHTRELPDSICVLMGEPEHAYRRD